jgi:4-hydroxy-3-polyprenylbenzoate decarboxylase
MQVIIDAGAKIVPPTPAFYNRPKSIEDLVDFVVARILSSLNLESDILQQWNSRLI